MTGGQIVGERSSTAVPGGRWAWGSAFGPPGHPSDVMVSDCWGDGIYVGGDGSRSGDIRSTVICDNTGVWVVVTFATGSSHNSVFKTRRHGSARHRHRAQRKRDHREIASRTPSARATRAQASTDGLDGARHGRRRVRRLIQHNGVSGIRIVNAGRCGLRTSTSLAPDGHRNSARRGDIGLVK